MNFGVNLLPVSNKSNSLGSSSKKWDNVYVDKINGQSPTAFDDSLSATQSGIAIIVSGDMAFMTVPVGGYAYIKDNTHGLAEGLYTNTSSAAFPASGGTADSKVFTAVSGGGLNAIQQSLDYSTTPSICGYYNGNPIYRKVFTSIPDSIGSYSRVLRIYGSCKLDAHNQYMPIPYIDSGGSKVVPYITSTGAIGAWTNGTHSNYYIVVEWLK